jgi:hypothetical protein
MSIEHFAAAFRCRKFKGGARLLLLALANRASDGKPSKNGKQKPPYVWSFAGTALLMMDIGASTRDTVLDNMKALVDGGVVKRQRWLSHSSLTCVDIEVLRSLAYTADDVEAYKKKADTKVGKSTTSGRNDEEKVPPLNNGNSTTTDVRKITLTDGGEIPTAVGGNSPIHNPKGEPQGMNTKGDNPSASESELVDADSDVDRPTSITSSSGRQEDSFSDPYDESPDAYIPGSSRAVVPPAPDLIESEPEPDPQEYADVVHLASLFWATHNLPTPIKSPSPEPPLEHPWGHPRTWKPWQRRDRFLTMMDPS